MKKVLIILAQDFADDEVLIPQKILNDHNIETVLCSLNPDSVSSSNGKLYEVESYSSFNLNDFDALIIAGGLKCVKHFKENWLFIESIISKPEHLILCGIGSVPAVIFAPLGLLEGKKATCLPSLYKLGQGFNFSEDDVCVSEDIISAKDKSCLEQYSLSIIKALS